MCLLIEEARRNRWQWGQCTLVPEPGLPTSGRDMWEDWLEVWREDLRILEEEVEAEEVEEVEEVEEGRVLSGSPDTQGAMAATADAEADS